MELERKSVRLTIRRLRKALKKFQADLEAAKQDKLQLKRQEYQAVEEQRSKAQQCIASWASLPPGQRDPRRRPWKKCNADEDGSAVTLNGHIEEVLGASVLNEGPGILHWTEKGIQELQLKENLDLHFQVA